MGRLGMRCGSGRGLALLGIGLVWASIACASPGPRVIRTDPAETIDLSGDWNDTDSRLVSEEMIHDALDEIWIDDFRASVRDRPTVIVGTVRNRTSEHIHTQTFARDLERAFVRSGRIRVVAGSGERLALREERRDQSRHSTLETAKSMGQELGADYMLMGEINTLYDALGGTELRYYQVELELVHLESSEKVWIGQKKIKKVIDRPSYRY